MTVRVPESMLGWSPAPHGGYCDHYAVSADGLTCERCGATRTIVFMPEMSPNHSKNQERCRNGEAPCFICGKPIASPRYWTHTYAGAEMCVPEYAEGTDGDSGCYPIGADCYRRLPAEAKTLVTKEPTGS